MEWRSLDSIKPYSRNTKKHTASSVQKLAEKIRKFGWDVPIVVDGDGVIIKGHRRLQVAKLLKLKQVPVIVRADLSPEEARAARLQDNRSGLDSLDDLEAIAQELSDLQDFDFNLALTGYDPAEIEKFLSDRQTEFQPPEPQGGMGGDGEMGGDPEEPPEEPEPKNPANPERYPLAIVLSWKEHQEWKLIKEKYGAKRDREAFLKLAGMEGEG
jgi:ParB-like chromosome segregation protein Spo0J